MITELLSRAISASRGTPFRLDPALPPSYLCHLVGSYLMRRWRGWLAFPLRRRRVFVGRRCQVIGKSAIRLGGPLNIGDACIINAVSAEGVHFGANVSVQRGTAIECTGTLQQLGKGAWIGDNVGIGSNSFLGAAGGIVIGAETIIGNFVSFHSENHRYDRLDIPIRMQGVRRVGISIGRDCWIGAKATILDGATIGAGCIVAAGAVVRAGQYPDHSILGGVPARIIGTRAEGLAPGDRPSAS